MASNETRARLLGWTTWEMGWKSDAGTSWGDYYECPPYGISRDACAELLEYVDRRDLEAGCPKDIETSFHRRFVIALAARIWAQDLQGKPFSRRSFTPLDVFAFLTATPAQITAAFDATFAKELAELEKTNGK